MFTVTLNKVKYIERNKGAIKRCPVTSLTHFYVIYDDNNSILSLKLFSGPLVEPLKP